MSDKARLFGYPITFEMECDYGGRLATLDLQSALTYDRGTVTVDLKRVLDIVHDYKMRTVPRQVIGKTAVIDPAALVYRDLDHYDRARDEQAERSEDESE